MPCEAKLQVREIYVKKERKGNELTLEIQMTKRRGRATIYHNKKKFYPSRRGTMLQPNSQPCRQCKRQFIFNINEPKKEVDPLLTEKENK
jgi:hypothetical protein